VEVQADAVEQWAAEVANAHGFSDISHTVEVFGLCGACS
jgi:Fur family ferric uptake transcriptional regulator